jgi:hypothetical protein
MKTYRALAAVLAVVAAGCAEDPGGGGVTPVDAPTEIVRHSYYPRLATEDYWETIRLAEAGPRFMLYVHPRIKTPAEGPWTATFRRSDGHQLSRHTGLRVDVATANFTFLCSSRHFTPGDWTLELEVEEGGLVSGDRKRLYRFRVE